MWSAAAIGSAKTALREPLALALAWAWGLRCRPRCLARSAGESVVAFGSKRMGDDGKAQTADARFRHLVGRLKFLHRTHFMSREFIEKHG